MGEAKILFFCLIKIFVIKTYFAMGEQAKIPSEDVLGVKLSNAATDTLIKTVTGAALGVVFSAALFKRKPWPIVLGAGIGIGAGIQNCQNDLKTPFAILPGKIVKVNKDQDS